MIGFKRMRLLCISLLGFALSSPAFAEIVELEYQGSPEGGTKMKLVEPAEASKITSIESKLDPNDCDPYMHIYLKATRKCEALKRKVLPVETVRASDDIKIRCHLSKDRYYYMSGTVDENAPCYGLDNGQLLRGEVIVWD